MSANKEPETRKVLQAHVNGVEYQSAVRWCTTHDCWTDSGVNCMETTGPGSCTISTGGPDHRWWEDVRE